VPSDPHQDFPRAAIVSRFLERLDQLSSPELEQAEDIDFAFRSVVGDLAVRRAIEAARASMGSDLEPLEDFTRRAAARVEAAFESGAEALDTLARSLAEEDGKADLEPFLDAARAVARAQKTAVSAAARHAVLALAARDALNEADFWTLYLPFAALIPLDTLEFVSED
jgi:hypothetical protein